MPKKLFPKRDIEVQDDALAFIEDLLFKLMSLVFEKNPHSIQDLEKIINSILPSPINDYAKQKAKSVLNECLETNHDSNLSLIQSSKKIVHLVSSSSISNQQPNVNLSNCSLVLCPIIKRIQQNCKLDIQTSVYLCALLEYIADDIFKLVCKYVENIGNDRIKLQDVKISLNADNLLMDLFYGNKNEYCTDFDEHPFSLIDELSNLELNDESTNKDGENPNNVYVNIVKELIKEERLFLRELNLIIKVFREPFIRLLNASSNSVPNTPTISAHNFNSITNHLPNHEHSQSTINSISTCNSINSICTQITSNDEPIIRQEDIDLIFSNVTDIYEFSINFLSQIEDTIEMNEESKGIGFCFLDMAEIQEFDVFQSFAEDLFELEGKQPHHHLNELFENQKVASCLSTSGKGVLLCIKYVLPKLMNGVIVHCLHYFDYIKLLMNKSPNEDDLESFRQCEGLLNVLKSYLERVRVGRNFKLNEGYLKLTKTHREKQFKNVKSKLDEMRNKIDGFNPMQYNQLCNEFIYEGVLSKACKGDKKSMKHIGENKNERYCFLFDGILICCRILNTNIGGGSTNNYDFKKKDHYFIRNLEVCDSDLDSKSFELVNNSKNHETKEVLIFLAKSKEEKDVWISNLLLLTQKPILERTLDSILSEEKRRIPLKLPDPKQYRFAEKDSEFNIIFDASTGKDLIKAATLIKLIERLTYHQFADPKLLKTFLTTYRSFCTPEMLLDLLIERFNIPFDDELTSNEHSSLSRGEQKRFKKEYLEPIQLRVLNVLKKWVESHYYDLDDGMKKKLDEFLNQLKDKKQRKNLIDSLISRLEKKEKSNEEKKRKYLCENLPPILYWYEKERNEFNLLTVHPVEFSRQLTLYEFDLYCAVNTFELMGAKWTKKDKHIDSPNILKLSQHNSRFTYWIEKEIVECANLDERQAIINRLVEMLQVLYELNNFNGLFEIISAFGRSSVHRLEWTFNNLPPKSLKTIEEIKELLQTSHFQRYQEHLRKINPPCVPFFGIYLTHILHLEEGNKDFIDDEKHLINFSKRRRIAEITSEIQQYQNQPYCLNVYPELRDFIANLDPLEGRTEKEFDDYTYNKSKEIEPKGQNRPPKGERKYKDLNLKSPGIKPSHTFTTSSSTISLHHSFSSNNNAIVSNHNHQTSTSSMTNNDNNNNQTTNAALQQSSNPQTPNHTPTSSTPTSPTQIHSLNNHSLTNQFSPRSQTIMAPIIVGCNSGFLPHQQHQFINNISQSLSQFRVPITPNLISNSNNFNYNSTVPNTPSLPNHSNVPPPLPPRNTNKSPNFVLQSNSAFNTPLLSTGSNQATNIFQFPNTSLQTPSSNDNQPPPLPPRRTPSQSPSPFFTPNSTLHDTSNLTDISSNDKPPPLPPKRHLPNNRRGYCINENPGLNHN